MIKEEIEKKLPAIISWRHQIHMNPETAYEEIQTSNFVSDRLNEFGLDHVRNIGVTGIVATIKGKKEGPKKIGLRADMDALPMQELNSFDHKSKIQGKMHACGHDGHTAILLGVSEYFSKHNDFAGTLHLIFQPAEEGEAGAKAMIEDGLFEKFPMDEIYGIHNWPGLEVGKILIKPGAILASNSRFRIKFSAKGSHAAMPEQGRDVILLASEFVMSIQKIISREISPFEKAVLSITKFNSGTAYNIMPDSAEICGCIRTLNNDVAKFVFKRIKEIGTNLAQSIDGTFELEEVSGYPATINSEGESQFASDAAVECFGKENVINDFNSSMGSEDFSFMLQKIPGCYALLGNGTAQSGNPCMLHNPQYDFNDKIIPLGMEYFITLVRHRLKV